MKQSIFSLQDRNVESGFHPLACLPPGQSQSRYLYLGTCPVSGAGVSLPRTRAVEQLSWQLQAELENLSLSEGKMFGLLLVQDVSGQYGYGKAFSGLLEGQAQLAGWAPPLHLPSPTPLEAQTLLRLEQWKLRLQALEAARASHPFPLLEREWRQQEAELAQRHLSSKAARNQSRLAGRDTPELQRESRRDSVERRDFRQARRTALEAPQADFRALEDAILAGKRDRRALSRALQAEMHQQFSRSVASSLGCQPEALFPEGLRTGTGDCCAPKLLAWAARHEHRPLAMAEFWYGPTTVGERRQGEFYPACVERCQPLLGPLLALALRPPLRVLYQDARLLVVDKPGGLLAVPGRYHWNQDCVLHRLQERWPEALQVHRLDLETSGVMVFARDPEAQAALQGQFAAKTARKAYQALLRQSPQAERGTLDHALAPDPERPGRYRLDPAGKPAVTEFRILDRARARVLFRPLTGRSHQLRVHAAQLLGSPIRGDRLYGTNAVPERLMLHSWRLEVIHPDGCSASFEAPPPF